MSDPQADWHVVKMEIKRVQTYLFASPRLNVMLGANVTLGEVSRGQWSGAGGFKPTGGQCLPSLAVECGARLPAGVNLGIVLDKADPLGGEDDPVATWSKGVLVRDASRLIATFPSAAEADRFCEEARLLLADQLPGVLLEASVARLVSDGDGGWTAKPRPEPGAGRNTLSGESLLDLPQFHVCEETGQGPANTIFSERRGSDAKRQLVAESVARKRRRAAAEQTHDVLGLMRMELDRRLKEAAGLDDRVQLEWVRDFGEVAGPSGYLGVVHADGNGMGQAYREAMKDVGEGDDREQGDEEPRFFERAEAGERLFYGMRTVTRKAFMCAMVETFAPVIAQRNTAEPIKMPVRPLMLAGDDLLLVCAAPHALPFVKHYAQGIKTASNGRVTIGAGVAIVRTSFPFHHTHGLVEELASSAKTLYRGLPAEERCSVVDWLSTTDSWHGDIRDTRREDAMVSYRYEGKGPATHRLVLTQKPYRILSDDTGKPSLEALLQAADSALHHPDIARSQLKGLAQALPKGMLAGRLAAKTMPKAMRHALTDILDFDPASMPWRSVALPPDQDSPATFITPFLDFLELHELSYLASQATRQDQGVGGGE